MTYPAPSGAPGHVGPRRRWRGPKRVPLSWILLAIPLVVGTVRIAMSLSGKFTAGGDVAFIELGIRQVFHGGTALGPYSRFGWHHPGPALFYLFAPLYELSGANSRVLFLEAWLLNGACVLGVVAIVSRRLGEPAARVAAVVLAIYISASGFSALINPWNPSLLAGPLILVMVAAAAAATGSARSLVVAAVAGTFLVQTDISAIPATTVAVGVGVLGLVLRQRSARGADGAGTAGHAARRLGPTLIVGGLVFAALWIPPVVQEALHAGTPQGGNLTTLLHFYLHPPVNAGATSHGLNPALAVVSDHATLIPLGDPADELGHRSRLLAAGALGLIALLTATATWRRSRFLAILAVLSVACMATAVVAATRVIGDYFGYLFFWVSALPVPGLIAAAIAVCQAVSGWSGEIGAGTAYRAKSVRGCLAALALAGMVGASGVATRVAVHGLTISFTDSPDARDVAAHMESLIGHRRSEVFTIDFIQAGFGDGPLILTLVKDGYHFHVKPELDLFFGDTAAPSRGPTFAIEQSGPTPPPTLAGKRVLTAGSLVMWLLAPASSQSVPSPTQLGERFRGWQTDDCRCE